MMSQWRADDGEHRRYLRRYADLLQETLAVPDPVVISDYNELSLSSS